MLPLQTNDNIDSEHLVNDIQNLYCVICTTVTVEKTWETHVTSSGHIKAAKRFDLLFEKSNDRVRCKFCCCEVSWKNMKQHEMSHFLIPWDKGEESYDKWEIFFANRILLWNDLFSCCLCDLTFTEWSIALVHVTDSKHQSLKEQSSRKFDGTAITSTNNLSFELLVKEGIFAFDELSFECKICQLQGMTISRVSRHLKGLVHICKKTELILKQPAQLSSEETEQLDFPPEMGGNKLENATSNNRHKVNSNSDLVHDVAPENFVQDSVGVPTEARNHNLENPKQENHTDSTNFVSKLDGRECYRQVCDGFEPSLRKSDEIDGKKGNSAALASMRPSFQSSEISTFKSENVEDVFATPVTVYTTDPSSNILVPLHRPWAMYGSQRYRELLRKIRGCDNIVLLEQDTYYCTLCRLELIKPDDVHWHVKTPTHLNSLRNSAPASKEQDEKMLEELNPTDFWDDYIIKSNGRELICLICHATIPSGAANVYAHIQGKAHCRSFKKYGCQNISRIGDADFYCVSCDRTLQGRSEFHLHVEGEKHQKALTIEPVEKPLGKKGEISRGQTSSSLCKPNSTKPKTKIASVEKLPCSLGKPNSTRPQETMAPVEQFPCSLRKPNSIKPKEELTLEKKLPSPLRERNSIEPEEKAAPFRKLTIPVRKPNTICWSEAIVERKKLTSSLRRPKFIDSRKEEAQGQDFHDFSGRSNHFQLIEQTNGSEKPHLEPPETYTDHRLLANNSMKNTTTMTEDPDIFQEFFEYITALNETAVFCEICRCTLSPSSRNISAHVMGKPHTVSLRDYGCDYIEKRNDLSYFCKCCDVPIIHLKEVYRHVNSPKHLYLVRDGKREKAQSPPKLNNLQRIIENKKYPALVLQDSERMISYAHTANGNCVDDIIGNDTIDLRANEIVDFGNHDYFCNRCQCKISGMINVHAHITGRKHQKH